MGKEFKIGQGTIESVLKRIGSAKSDLFCVGTDPLTQSGVIVSNGKIVSSRILDITIKPANQEIETNAKDQYLNKISVTYVDAHDKTIRTDSFDILNQEALYIFLNNILNFSKVEEKVLEIDEKINNFDEKLTIIDEKTQKSESQIENIVKDDVISVDYVVEPNVDSNSLYFNHIEDGIQKETKVDIIDKNYFKMFENAMYARIELLEQHIRNLEFLRMQ